MKNKKVIKSIKIKKRTVFLSILFVFVLFYGIIRSKNYEIEYTLNDIRVVEKYNKKEHIYEFSLFKGETEFYFAFPHGYVHKKKLLNSIDIKEKEDILCLLPESEQLSVYPQCLQNDTFISYHLVEDKNIIDDTYQKEIMYEEKTFNNINIYALNDKKYYIWNYEGFYVISNKEEKEIKLFKEDIYNIPLTIKVGSYLLMADYDEKYAFQKFYVINTKNDKVRELNLEKEIAFNSYFLGTTDKKAYLVDKKNKNEYEIYPKRLLSESIVNNNQGRILNNDKWEPISLNDLVNKENSFTYKKLTQYLLEENVLYKMQGDVKTKLSNKTVKEIVYSTEDTVYYLEGDTLYYYNDSDGEVWVISNFEWNFNYKNMIFIF